MRNRQMITAPTRDTIACVTKRQRLRPEWVANTLRMKNGDRIYFGHSKYGPEVRIQGQ